MAAITKTIVVELSEGLEPRKTAELVQLVCNHHTESVSIDYNGKVINPKSLMASMYLACPTGAQFVVSIDGPEAEAAMKNIEDFLKEQ